jgi:hypothetical protein
MTRLSGIGLRVTEEPSIPVASGYNVNWVGETAIEVQVGETFTFTPALQANRGIWTPAQSTQPLGAVRGGTITDVTKDAYGVPYNFQKSLGADLVGTPINVVVADLRRHEFEATVEFEPGSAVTNQYGVSFAAPAVTTLSPTNLTIAPYAPVFRARGVLNDVGTGDVQGTTKVFADTQHVYVHSHEILQHIEVPREPVEFAQFNPLFGNSWHPLHEWEKKLVSRDINGLAVPYWKVKWTGPTYRKATPVRVSFQS